ncbi:hypothetical protein D3C86_1813670 [compost metagenome]
MAKIAGTESTAKMTSANSIVTRARNRGVACQIIRPAPLGSRTKNFEPCSASVTGICRLSHLTRPCPVAASSLGLVAIIRPPVKIRKAAKTYSAHS